MSPLQVCLEGLKVDADAVVKLLCLSNVKTLSVRHTCMEAPSGPRLEVRRQRQWRRGGRMGKHLRGGVLMEMSAALNTTLT